MRRGRPARHQGAPAVRKHQGAQTVRRALALLRSIASSGADGVRLSDMAERLDMPRASVHRLAQALLADGLLEQPANSRRYRLGIEFFALAAKAAAPAKLRDICRPGLLRLGATIGDTVFLLAPSAYDVICIDRMDGSYPIRTQTEGIGGRIPLGYGPGPLAVLAFMPERQQEEVLRRNMPILLGKIAQDELALRALLHQVKQQGYVVSGGWVIPGLGGLSMPVRDRAGHAVAAISVIGLADRFEPGRIEAMLPIMRKEIDEIERAVNPLDATILAQEHRSLHHGAGLI